MRYRLQRHDGTDCSATMVPFTVLRMVPIQRYRQYAGIWHGMFFVVNLVRSWFTDALYKAEIYTAACNVFYWIFSILSVLGFLFGGTGSTRRDY